MPGQKRSSSNQARSQSKEQNPEPLTHLSPKQKLQSLANDKSPGVRTKAQVAPDMSKENINPSLGSNQKDVPKKVTKMAVATAVEDDPATNTDTMEGTESDEPTGQAIVLTPEAKPARTLPFTLTSLDLVNYSVVEFLETMKFTLDSFYYNDAEYICKAALEKFPDDWDVLWQCGKAYVDIGREKQAIQCIDKCIRTKPISDYNNYIVLARLLTGKNAINNYHIACDLILIENSFTEKKLHFEDLCKCYCAIAEIYLKTLRGDEETLRLCEASIRQAIDADEDHPLGYQTGAKLKIYEGKIVEAKRYLNQSISKWYPIYLSNRATVANLKLPDDYPEAMRILSYEERIQTVSLLLAVKNYDMAYKIIKSLLTEDEQVVEVQYYFALLLYHKGDKYHSAAKFRLGNAMTINEMTKTDDESIISNIEDLLTELGDVDTGDEEEGLCISEEDDFVEEVL